MNTTKLGYEGEKIAADYLVSNGYTVLKTNFKAAGGEIDIIALKGRRLSFVEVKTRKDNAFGYGADFVDYHKQQKIIRTARAFLINFDAYDEVTFDVCEVYTAKRCINYIENAFDE